MKKDNSINSKFNQTEKNIFAVIPGSEKGLFDIVLSITEYRLTSVCLEYPALILALLGVM